ncbi:hypothetical protein HD806DRAFT_171365 [Xylariaceae sp. AK1471]|nr:hypothetical protein HD806DRAFT_171365 [Xylariaceae sp. AK1471]
MQRILKKHSLLDEEKRVRQMELRKSGIPVGRRPDIPFGVRAIQSGIQVEGIWISRPVTPTGGRSSSKASSTTLEIDSELRSEEKGKAVLGSVMRPNTTVTEVEPTPRPSPRPSPTRSSFDQSIRTEVNGALSSEPQTTYLQPYTSQRLTNDTPNVTRYFNTTTQAEGTAAGLPIETYVPTSSFSSVNSSLSLQPRPGVDHDSRSSEEGLSYPHPRYPVDVRGRPVGLATHYRSPFDASESSPLAVPSVARGQYCSRVRAEMRGNPFESPETDRASSTHAPSSSRPSLASTRPAPVRTYSDLHGNTSSRRVNAGFEVLPAGTFSRSNSDNRPPNDTSSGHSR